MKWMFLLLAAFASGAHAQTYGDWIVSASDDGSVITAETSNDSGGSFGLMCFVDDGKCVWALITNQVCEDGGEYPVMANAKSGAYFFNLLCSNKSGSPVLVFKNFQDVENLVNKNERVGFAVPMLDGMFRVVRFSLLGSTQAAKQANDSAQRLHKTSTLDLKL